MHVGTVPYKYGRILHVAYEEEMKATETAKLTVTENRKG